MEDPNNKSPGAMTDHGGDLVVEEKLKGNTPRLSPTRPSFGQVVGAPGNDCLIPIQNTRPPVAEATKPPCPRTAEGAKTLLGSTFQKIKKLCRSMRLDGEEPELAKIEADLMFGGNNTARKVSKIRLLSTKNQPKERNNQRVTVTPWRMKTRSVAEQAAGTVTTSMVIVGIERVKL